MRDLSIVTDSDLQNFYETVSHNVKKKRIEQQKPQLDLVLEMGLKSTAFYSRCENCKDNHHFNLEHIYKIATILNIEICELLEGISTKTSLHKH
ncbi:MAG: XRE family transcriptional regulator [Campylobacterota bacterium]